MGNDLSARFILHVLLYKFDIRLVSETKGLDEVPSVFCCPYPISIRRKLLP